MQQKLFEKSDYTIPVNMIKATAKNHQIITRHAAFTYEICEEIGQDRPLLVESDGSIYLGQW